MANPHDHPTALKDLQDSIYREKILRARAMTPEQRFITGIELTNGAAQRMLQGSMARLGTSDEATAKADLRKRLDRIRKSEDHGFYSYEERAR